MNTPQRRAEIARVVAAALDVPAEHRAAFVARRCPDPSLVSAIMACLADEQQLQETFGAHSLLGQVSKASRDGISQNDGMGVSSEVPWVGSILRGPRGEARWEILDVKHGGCSLVYVGVDREAELEPLFAAKTYPRSVFSVQPRLIEMLEQEASVWTRIPPHHNVVTLQAVERIGGKPYLFMPYYTQGDLAAAIARGRLANRSRMCVYYAMQICDGLVHAYRHGVVAHRDIKPSNCFLHGEVHLSIADLGISRPSWVGEDITLGFGTPGYAPPEQGAAGAGADRRSDVYSIGATLFAMLTGASPDGREPQAMSGELRCHHSSETLNAIVRKCLSSNADRRFQSASELRMALGNVLEEMTGRQAPAPVEPYFGADDTLNLLHRANQHSELGENELALKLYDRIVAGDPNNAEARQARADTLWRLGRFPEARREAELAIELMSREENES